VSDRTGAVWDSLRTRLWPVPAAAVLLAVGLGVVLPLLDASVDDQLPPAVSALLFGGGPQAARSVLEAVSGSLITVTSLTFSLTVVTLQLASSQFSPRLLRTFSRDRFVHGILALFLATFAFALTVLRTVRTGEETGGAFVPEISVTVAFLLALASVLGLVLFLGHLTREIRVETMMRNVHSETRTTIDRMFPANPTEQPGPPPAPPGSFRITASRSGFLTSLDEEALLEAARASGAVVRIDRSPGSSLITGVPFATVWAAADRQALSTQDAAALCERVNAAVETGIERTNLQDVAFGFRQLVDVAAKALSPGINDPTTAVHVLAHLSSLLCCLVERNPGPRVLTDDPDAEGGRGDRVRVIISLPRLGELLDLAVSQPRLYGAQDPAVATRILELLQELTWCDTRHKYRSQIAGQLEQMKTTIDAGSYTPAEYSALTRLCQETTSALARHPPSP
jgi:uncharacterized membrane protein